MAPLKTDDAAGARSGCAGFARRRNVNEAVGVLGNLAGPSGVVLLKVAKEVP